MVTTIRMNLLLQKHSRYSQNPWSADPQFEELLQDLIDKKKVYMEFSGNGRRMALKEMQGAIGFVKSISMEVTADSGSWRRDVFTETDPSAILNEYRKGPYPYERTHNRRGWTNISIVIGFTGRNNRVTVSYDEFESIFWLKDYVGDTFYVSAKEARNKKKEALVANAKDAFDATINKDDIVIFYHHGIDNMGAGVVTNISARTRYNRLEPVITVRDLFDSNTSVDITAFHRVVKLTDRLKNDVMIRKLMDGGGILCKGD